MGALVSTLEAFYIMHVELWYLVNLSQTLDAKSNGMVKSPLQMKARGFALA